MEFEYARINGLYNDSKIFSRNYVAIFYRNQLKKFNKIGLGGETENGIEITTRLIETTTRRYEELKPMHSIRKARENKRENKWQL